MRIIITNNCIEPLLGEYKCLVVNGESTIEAATGTPAQLNELVARLREISDTVFNESQQINAVKTVFTAYRFKKTHVNAFMDTMFEPYISRTR